MKYAFLAENQARWPVSVLCEVMQVSRSGFYAYQRRQAPPVIDPVEGALLARVQAIAAATRESYGSRRMAKQLPDDGLVVGRCKARRLRREAGGRVRRAKPRGPITTESRQGDGMAENVLARHCEVAKPAQAGAGTSRISRRRRAGCLCRYGWLSRREKEWGGRCVVRSRRRWCKRR